MSVWIPVMAALGASIITAGASLGLLIWERRRIEAAELRSARKGAYSRLLAVSGLIGVTAQVMHSTMEFRSGIGEGVDVLTRIRRPTELADVDARLREDLVPLFESWSDIWSIGSSSAVHLANRLVDAASAVVQAATTEGKKHGRVAARVVGERWTKEQIDHWRAAEIELAERRRDFAEQVRREMDVEAEQLFIEQES